MILPVLSVALLLVAGGDEMGAASRLYDPGNVVDAEGIVRGRDGARIGHVRATENGRLDLFDRDGRRVGFVEPGFSADELVIRDGAGRRQGTLGRRR